MADLSASDKTYIRNMTGDTDTTSPHLSDDFLEYLFDNKADSNVDKTVVYALRSLLGIAAEKVSQSNARTGDSKSNQQWYEHLLSLISKWEGITGLSASTVTTGTINLGIDEEDETFNIT